MYKLTAYFPPGSNFKIIASGEVTEEKGEFDPIANSTCCDFTSDKHFGISVEDREGNSLVRFYGRWEE